MNAPHMVTTHGRVAEISHQSAGAAFELLSASDAQAEWLVGRQHSRTMREHRPAPPEASAPPENPPTRRFICSLPSKPKSAEEAARRASGGV